MHQFGRVPATPTCILFGRNVYKITSVWNSFGHSVSLPQLAPKMPSAGIFCMGVRIRTTFWYNE